MMVMVASCYACMAVSYTHKYIEIYRSAGLLAGIQDLAWYSYPTNNSHSNTGTYIPLGKYWCIRSTNMTN